MKTTKHILLLAALLLLTACQAAPASSGSGTAPATSSAPVSVPPSSDPPAGEPDAEPAPEPEPEFSDRDNENRYTGSTFGAILETEDLFVGPFHNYVYYYDKDQGFSDVLCGRPECMHSDRSCDGFLGVYASNLTYREGKLYWLGCNQLYGDPGYSGPIQYGIWRMTLGQNDREFLVDLEQFVFKSGQTVRGMIYRGDTVYLDVHSSDVKDAVPTEMVRLYKLSLHSGEEPELLVEQELHSSFYAVNMRDPWLYLLTVDWNGDEENRLYTFDYLRYNVETDQTEALMHTEPLPMTFRAYRMAADGTAYLCTYRAMGTDGDVLYRIRDGALEPVLDCTDPEGDYSGLFLGEEICQCTRMNEDGSFDIWFRTLDGETLYKGPWDRSYRPRPKGTHLFALMMPLGGYRDFYFFNFIDIDVNKTYLVRYDVSPEGLTETVLWSD